MDIEQLRDIVKSKDGDGFCQFFRQLKPEEILKLSEEEYQEIMNLVQQIGREEILRDGSFFVLINKKSIEFLEIATIGKDVRSSSSISIFYNDLFLNLYPTKDGIFALNLMRKGINLSILAEQGVNTIYNLNEAIKCYDEAYPILKMERDVSNYARTMKNKGTSLLTLAEQGINTIKNLEESKKCYGEAAPIFKRTGEDLSYAGTLMDRGTSLLRLTEQDINTIDNLKEAIECYSDAAFIFNKKKANINYARSLMNKGIGLRRLSEKLENTEEKLKILKEAIGCYDLVANIFKKERAELDYAITIMNKGYSLFTLAAQDMDTIKNLKESIKYYDEAAKISMREKSELLYAETLTNKGLSLRILVEKGVNVERNLSLAIALYHKTEDIFIEKGSLINFIISSVNHILALLWKFQETNDDKYLAQGKKLCEKAFEVAPHITHPVKGRNISLLNSINAILADKYLASDRAKYYEIIKKLDEIKKDTERIPPLEEKINLILASIDKSTQQIIEKIKESGEKVSEEVARGFTSLPDDLRALTEDQQRKLLEEFSRLLTDPSFQRKFLRESTPEKRGVIKSIFQRIKKTANEIAGHMPTALIAHQIYYYIDSLLREGLHLSNINSSLILGMVLLPLLAFKDRLF